jgi:outer membrane protein OmpA-like peptidoglycan-associated protein
MALSTRRATAVDTYLVEFAGIPGRGNIAARE